MQEQLRAILPYIQNVTLALGVLFIAYVLTLPLHRRYASSDGIEVKRHSARQFLGILLTYPAFSVLVLLFSLPVVRWFYHAPEPPDTKPYGEAWLLFWGIHAILRLIEGLLVEMFVQMGRACPLSRLSRGLLHLAIMMGVAFMLIKYQLGFEIGVLLTSTAIVTGVIGFAMQGVLGNLLAGMSLHACRTLGVGEWIHVDGVKGQVILVNWRETRVRTLGGHVVIVPNSKIADAKIYNYSSPTNLRRHEVLVAASYGDPPADVIAALTEAADCIPSVEKHPAPDAYITGFKDFCIEYALRFWSKHYERRTAIEGDVMRMIWYKFQRRGIEIPFPMSGRLLGNFLEAVHAQKFEKPLASEIEQNVDDMLHSDFGRKLLANSEGVCILSRDELRTVARTVKRTRFTYGETLMRQGEGGESFYALVEGKIHGIIANSDGARPVEFDLEPGSLFGEMSLLTGLPRSATMTAVTNCELLEFDRAAFTQLLALREEIPRVLSDLAAARAAQNAASLEKLKASAVVPPELARDGILRRLKRMLGDRKGR
ncbi:MAG TPA: mechanosensitive ion channel family protein [Sedimentisphaerales bacterium]|nr:mechanosensitive ion channel family protein [Sedimentisphaerales bacterium]